MSMESTSNFPHASPKTPSLSREMRTIDNLSPFLSQGGSASSTLSPNAMLTRRKEHRSVSYPLDMELQRHMQTFLGNGPMRFGPAIIPPEINVRKQLIIGDNRQLSSYIKLRSLVELKKKIKKATDEQVLRIVQFCLFHDGMAYDLLKRARPYYFQLTATDRQRAIEHDRLVVPLPSLRVQNEKRSRVLYFRPSRYFPKDRSKSAVIDSLIYVLDDWARHDACVWSKQNFAAEPVTYCLLVHLLDFGPANYSKEYWSKMMALIQGRVFPVRVNMVLWVDPPLWFEKIWQKMVRLMFLSDEFAKRNHRLSRYDLGDHLEPSFNRFLPADEFPDMYQDANVTLTSLARDYIIFRKYIETMQGKSDAHSHLAKKRQKSRRRFSMPTNLKITGRRSKDRRDERVGDLNSNSRALSSGNGNSLGLSPTTRSKQGKRFSLPGRLKRMKHRKQEKRHNGAGTTHEVIASQFGESGSHVERNSEIESVDHSASWFSNSSQPGSNKDEISPKPPLHNKRRGFDQYKNRRMKEPAAKTVQQSDLIPPGASGIYEESSNPPGDNDTWDENPGDRRVEAGRAGGRALVSEHSARKTRSFRVMEEIQERKETIIDAKLSPSPRRKRLVTSDRSDSERGSHYTDDSHQSHNGDGKNNNSKRVTMRTIFKAITGHRKESGNLENDATSTSESYRGNDSLNLSQVIDDRHPSSGVANNYSVPMTQNPKANPDTFSFGASTYYDNSPAMNHSSASTGTFDDSEGGLGDSHRSSPENENWDKILSEMHLKRVQGDLQSSTKKTSAKAFRRASTSNALPPTYRPKHVLRTPQPPRAVAMDGSIGLPFAPFSSPDPDPKGKAGLKQDSDVAAILDQARRKRDRARKQSESS